MNNPSQTKDMNELNNEIRHVLGWCLYSPPEKECQHLPVNEDDEETISELLALFTEQVRLGEKRGQLKGYNSGWVAGTRNVGVKKYAYFAKELEDAAKKLRNIEAQLKATTLLEGEKP